jgi:hypothetical protein
LFFRLQLSSCERRWFNISAESRYDAYHHRDVVRVIYDDITQGHQPEICLAEAIVEMHLVSRLLGLPGKVFLDQFQNSGRVKSMHKDGNESFPIRLFKWKSWEAETM